MCNMCVEHVRGCACATVVIGQTWTPCFGRRYVGGVSASAASWQTNLPWLAEVAIACDLGCWICLPTVPKEAPHRYALPLMTTASRGEEDESWQ